MRKERVVEVWAGLGGGSWSCGSGYLVAARLVLTAAHVIVGEVLGHRSFHMVSTSEDVRVRTLHSGEMLTGKVVWRGEGPDLDIALVEITDGAWQPDRVAPVRWGRTTCQKTRVDCEATGFPQVLKLPDRRRDREQLSGGINPGTGEKSGHYHVRVDDAPTRHMGDDSPWAGMSGAALFSGDLLIGVVVVDHGGFDGRRLTAVRMTEAFRNSDFVGHITRHRVTSVEPSVPNLPTPVLESAELASLFAGPRLRRRPRSPATLLTAQVAAVRWFRGRDDKIAGLLDWMASPEPLEARLIVGPGGHGKTRLARELENRARTAGWITGMIHAETADRLPAEPLERLASCEMPLLLVVDYAETRPRVVRRLLECVDPEDGPAIRLLMLARSPGQWWEQLWGSTRQLQDAVALDDVEVLGPLPEQTQRTDAFREAVADLSHALPQVHGLVPANWTSEDWAAAAGRVAVPDLSQSRYGSIMRVHLAALVALLQEGSAPAPTTGTQATHEDVLITHERAYWNTSADSGGLGLTEDTLANAVTVATLLGAVDRDEALAVLARVRGLDRQSEDQLMAVDQWLTTLYPTSGEGRWGAFEPDRLGEYLVGMQLRNWPKLLDKPLAAATSAQLHRAFHVLARAGVDHVSARELMRTQVIEQLLRTGSTALAVAVETEEPAFLIEALEEAIQRASGAPEILAALADGFPAEAPALATLAEHIARLEKAVYQRLLAAGLSDYHPHLARATRRHSDRLRALGREDEALAVQSEAVEMFRDLAGHRPNEEEA